MRNCTGSALLGVTLVVTLTLSAVACQHEVPRDPGLLDSALMYFVQDGPGSVVLVIEPNDVIPPHAELAIKFEANGIWVGGFANPDGSYTSEPFHGEVGDVVRVTATSAGALQWEACVLIGNFGHPPEPCP